MISNVKLYNDIFLIFYLQCTLLTHSTTNGKTNENYKNYKKNTIQKYHKNEL